MDQKKKLKTCQLEVIKSYFMKLQGGYGHSGYMNEKQLVRPYVRYEGEGGHQELPGQVSGEEASWVYRGHGYSFESGGELGGSDAHILSGSLRNFSDGPIKHNIDHPSGVGGSGDYSVIF